MSLLRPSLTRRILGALVMGFLLAWAAFVGFTLLTLAHQQEQDGRNFADSPLGLQVRDMLAGIDDPAQAAAIVAAYDRNWRGQRQRAGIPVDVEIQLLDRRGRRVAYGSSGLMGVVLRGDPGKALDQWVHGRQYRILEVDTERWAFFWARTRIDYPWVAASLTGDVSRSIAIAFPCLLLPLWLAVFLGLRPLRKLSNSIAARGADDMSPVGAFPKQVELQPLVVALDQLLARLRRKIAVEQNLVASAAHELRTPLAVMTTEAHVLAKSADMTERVAAEVRLDRAAARASHLIHQLLTLARMDMGRRGEAVSVDLAQLTRQELASFVAAASGKNIELSLDAPDSLMMRLDPQLLRSVIQNLIDNAIRYGSDGGRVIATLVANAGQVSLTIADDGPGIPESERASVFERFFRGANAGDTEGTGLGLAIVRKAAADLGGTLRLHEGLAGRGCSFVVELPA